MKKRILSLALAICMLLTSVPTSFAGYLAADDASATLWQDDSAMLSFDAQSYDDQTVQQGLLYPSDVELPSQERQQGILYPSDEEQPTQERQQGILYPSDEEQPTQERQQGILYPSDEEQPTQERQQGILYPSDGELPELTLQDKLDAGLLVVECNSCGYLDNNHAADCPVIQPPKPVIQPSVAAELRKPAIIYSETYLETYAELMASETLEDFEAVMDSLNEDQQAEMIELLSDEELDELTQLEDALTQSAIVAEPQKTIVKKVVSNETRAMAFGAAHREALRSLGYELIVNMYGRIVECVDMLASSYTMLETVSPAEDANYQWQILADDVWVDIQNEIQPQIRVSYAMVASLLDRDDAVELRCEIDNDGDLTYTDPVEIFVEYDSDDVILDARESDEEDSEEEELTEEELVEEEFKQFPDATRKSLRKLALPEEITEGEDSIMLLADEGGSENPGTQIGVKHNVVINYVYEADGNTAAASHAVEVLSGNNYKATVENPIVRGYDATGSNVEGFTFDSTNNTVQIDLENVQRDYQYTVEYIPGKSSYTVVYYQQDVLSNGYTEVSKDRKIIEGVTGDAVDKKDFDKSYPGFYQLPVYNEKDPPTIAADGSTLIEVYYDRGYYLMSFDLDGGYGTEPIYARYGSSLASVAVPTRVGYTFQGWTLDGKLVDLPSTMPPQNRTYKAVWKTNDSAKVTVVFWGENANDPDYSYVSSGVAFAQPNTSFTYAEGMQLLTCGKETHTHDASCKLNLTCGKTEHSHSTDCCSKSTNHTHNKSCYDNVGKSQSLNNAPWNPVDGQIYVGRTTTYIYISGSWYRYNGNANSGEIVQPNNDCPAHTHGDSDCECKLTAHSHTDACYTYSCGLTDHTHNNTCRTDSGLSTDLWTLNTDRTQTVTVAPDGTTVLNVYYYRNEFRIQFYDNENYNSKRLVYTIQEKWGASISSHWPIKGTTGITYNNGERWDPDDDTNTYTEVLVHIATMPAIDFDLYVDISTNTLRTMYYYVEALPDESPEVTYNGKEFVLAFEPIQAKYGHFTEAEDFFTLEGFDKWTSNPPYSSSGSVSGYNTISHYYTRHSYKINFYNPTDLFHVESSVYYGEKLGGYDWTPAPEDAPAIYEPGSVEFAGWYLSPECTGDEYILADHTMPSATKNGDVALTLYAKWEPKTHTVRFFRTEKDYLDEKVLDDATFMVSHGLIIDEDKLDAIRELKNGDAKIIAWFYKDANGNERAFDLANMPVTQDLDLYAKWDSGSFMNYVIYYKKKNTNGSVSDPLPLAVADVFNGFARVGDTLTFYAKGGNELYEQFREGFFPEVKSHSITIAEDGTTGEWYPAGPDGETENSFTFWYVEKESVPYKVRYLDKATGQPVVDGETGQAVEDKIVSPNKKAVVSATFKAVTGYVPDAYQKSLVITAEGVDSDNDGVIDENVIIFYYTKDTERAYYKVSHYIQEADGSWAQPEPTEYSVSTVLNKIGTPVEIAPITISGFTFDAEKTGEQNHGVVTAEGLHLKLYYKRNPYPYKVMYVDKYSGEELAEPKIVESALFESKVTESPITISNYEPVSKSPKTIQIRVETKENLALNVIRFEYVREATELTITKMWKDAGENCATCYGQDAIFTITGGDLPTTGLQFVISYDDSGKNTVRITGLKAGYTYIVTEDSGWSWRFTPVSKTANITLDADENQNKLTFTNNLNSNKIYWFDGSYWKRNYFGDPKDNTDN